MDADGPTTILERDALGKVTHCFRFVDLVIPLMPWRAGWLGGLRLKGGRIGFRAAFKNGVIISWSPITQVNGK